MRVSKKILIVFSATISAAVLTLFLVQRITWAVNAYRGHWSYEGPVQWVLEPPMRPVIAGDKVVILERHRKKWRIGGFRIVEIKMNFIRDKYFLTARRLKDGSNVYSRTLVVKGQPLQIGALLAWGDKIVVWGYYQEKPGLDNRICTLIILDERGKTVKELNFTEQPFAVDQKNGFLICRSRMYKLPSCEEEVAIDIEPFTYIVADNVGNLYVNNLFRGGGKAWKDLAEKRVEGIPSIIRKYSVLPWKRLWEIEVTAQSGYPRWLKYEDGLLWCAITRRGAGVYQPEEARWLAPFNAETGEAVQSRSVVDMYRQQAEVAGRRHVVTREDEKLVVRSISND